MKRLLGLAVLFAVLSVSVPSYGVSPSYFLIYNVSCTVKGVNNGANASIPWKAYLVLHFIDSCDTLVDANLIMYGKDSNTPKKQNVYVQLNKLSGTTPLINPVLYGGPYWGPSMIFEFETESDAPFYFQAITSGKAAYKDIGAPNTKRIATSLKGSILVWDGMLLDADDLIMGTGTISLSLYTATTKYVNQNGWTQDQIIELGSPAHEGLIPMLETKGYVAATMPK